MPENVKPPALRVDIYCGDRKWEDFRFTLLNQVIAIFYVKQIRVFLILWIKKANRPFVGILLEVCGINYYAPLS